MAADSGGDALLDLFNLIGIGQHGTVRMAVRVDKSGGDGETAGVDHTRIFAADKTLSDMSDLTVLDRDVSVIGGHTRSVDKCAVFDNEIVHNRFLRKLFSIPV